LKNVKLPLVLLSFMALEEPQWMTLNAMLKK
jgi:hypothetical protein